jgi:hypothetical protein
MYSITARLFDALTLKAAYPSCQAKLDPCWFNHRELIAFQFLHCLGQRHGGGQGNQQVKMIAGSTGYEGEMFFSRATPPR